MTRIFLLLLVSFIVFQYPALGDNSRADVIAQSNYDINIFDDGAPPDPVEQARWRQYAAKQQAREGLLWSSVVIAIAVLMGCLLLWKGASMVAFVRSLPQRLRVSKKLKIIISINTLWLLALLFTNNFQFENIFEMNSDDWRGFFLLAGLFLIFSFVCLALYRWVTMPEGAPLKVGMGRKSLRSALEVTRDRKFYIKRLAALLVLASGLFIVALLMFNAFDVSPSARLDIILGGILSLVVLVFSAPLGFWRKCLCWLIGMAVLVFARSIFAAIVNDIMTLAGPTEPEKAAEALGNAFMQAYNASIVISVVAVSIGLYVVGTVQKRWRRAIFV